MSVFEQTAKINAFLAALIAVAGAVAWSQPAVAGSDLWWHLASGRDMWDQLSVHRIDPFSYSFAGRAWMNHEWLWDVIYWGFYQIHPQAVAWLNLSVVTGIYTLAFLVARKASGSALASGLVLWFVAASAHWFLDIRPHLFTLLLVATFLLTRDKEWAPWLWPVLVILWANLHSGFVFGVGAIGLYVLVKTLEASWQQKKPTILPREWTGVALCLVAMLFNPYGYHIFEYPLDYLDSESPFRNIIEWKPPGLPDLSGGLVEGLFGDFVGRFWVVVFLAIPGMIYGLFRDRYLFALCCVTFAMAWTSRRFIPLFGITVAPLAASAIGWVITSVTERVRILDGAAARITTTVVAALIAVFFWQSVRIYPNLLERWTESTLYPDAALRYLKAIGQPERLLNYYNWGGFVMLHMPGTKLFIDGRANTLYDDEIYLHYLSMLQGRSVHERAALYPAEAALFPSNSRVAQALAQGPRPWRRVYADAVAEILLPPDSPRLREGFPNPERVLADHPDYLLSQVDTSFKQRRYDLAERYIRRAIEINPLMVRAHGRLAIYHSLLGDIDGVEKAIAEGIRNVPRRKGMLKQYEAQAFERLGDLKRALEAYRQAIPTGPFSYPGGMKNRIKRMEQRLEAGA